MTKRLNNPAFWGLPGLQAHHSMEALLADLQEVHDGLLDALTVNERVIAEPHHHANRCSLARWRLARARMTRHQVLNRIYLALAAGLPRERLGVLRSLQEDEVDLSRATSDHVRNWTAERVATDWTGFCEEAAQLMARYRQRVAVEHRLLYPLLLSLPINDLEVPRAAATLDSCATSAVA